MQNADATAVGDLWRSRKMRMRPLRNQTALFRLESTIKNKKDFLRTAGLNRIYLTGISVDIILKKT